MVGRDSWREGHYHLCGYTTERLVPLVVSFAILGTYMAKLVSIAFKSLRMDFPKLNTESVFDVVVGS